MVAVAGFQVQDGVRYVIVPPSLRAVATRRPDGDFRMLTAAQAAPLTPGYIALLDSSMFRAVGAQNRGESDTTYYRRVDRGMTNYRLVDRANGIDVPSRRPRDGMTLSIKLDGSVSVQSGDAIANDTAFAVQLYPPLVRGGRVVASNVGPNAQTNWRAGLGVLRSGNLVFAIGRKSMVDFARAMLAAGAVDAGYTDGGGSGLVQIAGGDRYGSTEDRPVPVWLAAMPLASGASPRPYGSQGSAASSRDDGAIKVLAIGTLIVASVAAAIQAWE